MKNSNQYIWVWLHDLELYKAVYEPTKRTLIVSNEQGNVILQYKSIISKQLIRLEELFFQLGAKHLDGRNEPFIYL